MKNLLTQELQKKTKRCTQLSSRRKYVKKKLKVYILVKNILNQWKIEKEKPEDLAWS